MSFEIYNVIDLCNIVCCQTPYFGFLPAQQMIEEIWGHIWDTSQTKLGHDLDISGTYIWDISGTFMIHIGTYLEYKWGKSGKYWGHALDFLKAF